MLDIFQHFFLSAASTGLAILALGELLIGIVVVRLWIDNRRSKAKLTTFFSGKDAKNLEEILTEQLKEAKALDQEIQELFEISNRLRALGMKSIHKTGVSRFNPFKEVGGNQSFCVALLDGKNSGVVLSSLHTREGTRVYAKPVLAGNAQDFPFTEEEKSTISQAIQSQ